MRKLTLVLIMALALATPAQAKTVTVMCTNQYMTHDTQTGEVRVWSDMHDSETGNVYEFWQWVAYNEYRVGITYEITFDADGNFASITETEY